MKKNSFKFLMVLMVPMTMALLATTAVNAQTWAVPKVGKFLTVPAVYATNTLSITNLATGGSVGTNVVGTTYTNKAGTRVVVTSGGLYATQPLLQDVSIYPLQNGSGAWPAYTTNGLINYHMSYATLSTTMTAGSGADTAVTFVVTPIYNGVNEATEAGDLWTFSLTPVVSTTKTYSTNAPLWKWPGAQKLRLKRIVNADTDASSQVIITDVSLNQFGPP